MSGLAVTSAPHARFGTLGRRDASRPSTAPLWPNLTASSPTPGIPDRRALSAPGRPPRGAGLLTPLELRVLDLSSHGATTARIARELHITEATAVTHLRRMFKKLGVRDRASMVAAGFRLGLLCARPLRPGVVAPVLPRQLAEMVPLLAEGVSNAGMAVRLGLTVAGVNHRMGRLYRLLEVGSREHAVRIAVEAGYLELGAAAGAL